VVPLAAAAAASLRFRKGLRREALATATGTTRFGGKPPGLPYWKGEHMRHTGGTPRIRYTAMIVVALTLMASLVVPAVAMAVTTPRSTLRTSTRLMAKAKRFTISGRVPSRYKGKYMTIEIRKPGRTYWDKVGTAKISRTGRWSYGYTPKLGGKFYIRARYMTGGKLSRTARLTVRRGPGKRTTILLASTTSTRDSGLMELLKPTFLMDCPEYAIKDTYVGSGAAINLGAAGNADVLLTHSPAAEVNFMNGFAGTPLKPSVRRGLRRYKVMYNHYLLVGPTGNPAGVALGGSAKSAFELIQSSGSDFWSRNDASGTNAKELEIWKSLNIIVKPAPSWYKSSGTMGMAQALGTINGAGGYTLADEATWLNWRNLQADKKYGTAPSTYTLPDPDTGGLTNIKDINIQVVNAGDPTYFNQYSVIEVKGAKNVEGAQDFSNWIRTPKAQALIRGFGTSTYGKALFVPNAGSY
jgi:tungstate transport system substrate-binding protein